MKFGPEIKVDGKRPEWLKDDDEFIPCSDGGEWSRLYQANGISNWEWLEAIRLPDDHPHYNLTTHTYTVRPEDEAALLASDPLSRSTPTPDERAVALVKRIASETSMAAWLDHTAEARAIVSALEPVDEDLVMAREIAYEQLTNLGASSEMIAAYDISKGERDDAIVVHVALAAIKRGRQLQRDAEQVWGEG